MSANTFTVADQILLAQWGIADVEDPRPRSQWAYERVLEAAADGSLTAPDFGPDAPEDLPVLLDGREATAAEARAIANLRAEGDLLLDGTRIALTLAGRELLNRWALFQRFGGEQG